MNPPSGWNIGLSAWIIQDSNYPDFAVGETVEFAVEFYHKPGSAIEVCHLEISARHAGETAYEVVAENVLATDAVTVLDVGILVYCERASQFNQTQRGDRFRTVLDLGIDPYFYFEALSKDPGVPALIYSWRISSILRQTAPFIEIHPDAYSRGKTMVRDESKLGYEEIPRTDAWQDDDGYAEYILRCDLLPRPAMRVSSRAGRG